MKAILEVLNRTRTTTKARQLQACTQQTISQNLKKYYNRHI